MSEDKEIYEAAYHPTLFEYYQFDHLHAKYSMDYEDEIFNKEWARTKQWAREKIWTKQG